MSPSSHHPASNLEIAEISDSSYNSTPSVNRSSNRHPTPLAVVQLRRVAVPAPPKKGSGISSPGPGERVAESSANMISSSRFNMDLDENALVDLGIPHDSSGQPARPGPPPPASDSAIDRLVSPGSSASVPTNTGRSSELFDLDSTSMVDLDRRNATRSSSGLQLDASGQESAQGSTRRSFEEDGEEIYFVTREGIDQGPYTIATLEKMVDVGSLGSAQVLTRVVNNQEMLAIDHPILRNRFEANLNSPPTVLHCNNRYATATGHIALPHNRAWSTLGWISASTFVYAVIAWVLWMRTTS